MYLRTVALVALAWGAALAAVAYAVAEYAVDTHGWAALRAISDPRLAADYDDESEVPPSPDIALLNWASQFNHSTPNPDHTGHCVDCFLVIGVKSSVVHGFLERQAVRETWAETSTVSSLGVRVVFLGCEPDLSAYSEAQQRNILAAIELEKHSFQDLLTTELDDCQDSYFQLVEKTKAFLQWTTLAHPAASYIMLADVDVYMRVDRVVRILQDPATPRTRYYAGQVWASQYNQLVHAVRDSRHKNHVSEAQYPMRQLPPFAIGPHYVLSSDNARFIARNRQDLRGVGTLEDVSVAFWLMALLQVHPVEISGFQSLRNALCRSDFVSYADVSPNALRAMHSNVVNNRSLCVGFSFADWDNKPFHAQLPDATLKGEDRVKQVLSFAWDLQWLPVEKTLQILIKVTADNGETAELTYVPAITTFYSVCDQLRRVAETAMPTTELPATLCVNMRTELGLFLDEAVTERDSTSPIFVLARSNLRHGATSAIVRVHLTENALPWRSFVESAMAAVFPDAHVSVVPIASLLDSEDVSPLEADIIVTTPLDGAVTVSSSSRIIMLSTQPLRDQEMNDRMIIIAPLVDSTQHACALSLPQASLSFARRFTHSPADLLRATTDTVPIVRRGVTCIGCRSPRSPVTSVAVEVFKQALGSRIEWIESEGDDDTTDDDKVAQLASFQFTVIAADAAAHRVSSDSFANVFLAGSVPLFIGRSAPPLFNARAFVDCSQLPSIAACAEALITLAASPRYEAMRKEPPIVDHEAFFDTFSWHPAVAAMAPERESFSHRFKRHMLEM